MVLVGVVYESMFGATRRIAEAIARGVDAASEPGVEVLLTEVGDPVASEAEMADVLVLGGPTHAHSMSREGSRSQARRSSEDPRQELVLEPDAPASGIRELLKDLDPAAVVGFVAFDTRLDAPEMLTGSAARAIRARLAKRGIAALMAPQSFLVDKHNRLLDAEEARAEHLGRQIAVIAREATSSSSHPAHRA